MTVDNDKLIDILGCGIKLCLRPSLWLLFTTIESSSWFGAMCPLPHPISFIDRNPLFRASLFPPYWNSSDITGWQKCILIKWNKTKIVMLFKRFVCLLGWMNICLLMLMIFGEGCLFPFLLSFPIIIPKIAASPFKSTPFNVQHLVHHILVRGDSMHRGLNEVYPWVHQVHRVYLY